MLSIPGMPSDLWIGISTTIEVVQVAIQRSRWLLNVIVDPNNKGIQGDWNADEFHANISIGGVLDHFQVGTLTQ